MANPVANADVFQIEAGLSKQLAGLKLIQFFGFSFSIDQSLLRNDTDADGDALSIVSVGGQSLVDGSVTVTGSDGGLFTVSEDGTLLFDAQSGFEDLRQGESRVTTVSYTITDENGDTSSSTISVTVLGQDGDFLTVNDDFFSTDQNTVITGGTLADLELNDSSVDGSQTLISVNGNLVVAGQPISTQGSAGGLFMGDGFGGVSFDPNGDFDYLSAGESATTWVEHTYVASNGETATSRVIVEVSGVDDAPDVVGETFDISAGESGVLASLEGIVGSNLTIDKTLLANDSDPESGISITSANGQTLVDGTATVAGSDGGIFTISETGELSFDAQNGFEYLREGESVETSVTYTVVDDTGLESTATATVTVNGVDGDAIEAPDLEYYWSEDDAAQIKDTVFNQLSTVTSFDGNHAPWNTETGDFAQAFEFVNWSNGGISWVDELGNAWGDLNGAFEYLSAGETAVTTREFAYIASNGEIATSTYTAYVSGADDAPDLGEDSFTVDAGTFEELAYTLDQGSVGPLVDRTLLKNDSDAEGDAFSIVSAGGQALVGGSVSVQGNNGGTFIITETGDLSFDGQTGFEILRDGESIDTSVTYTVRDATGLESSTTVTVTVLGKDGDYIVVQDDPGVTDQNTAITSTLAGLEANDWSVDGIQTLIEENGVAVVSGVAGSVAGTNGGIFSRDGLGNGTFDPNGEFDYLDEGESAETSLAQVYEASNGETDTAFSTIQVTGINDAPNVVGESYSIAAGTVQELAYMLDMRPVGELVDRTLLKNDSDAEGHSLSVVALNGVALVDGGLSLDLAGGGTVSITENGVLEFDATQGFSGLGAGNSQDIILTYTVADERGLTSDAQVVITVAGQDDTVLNPAVAQSDSFDVNENDFVSFNAADLLANDSGSGNLSITGIDTSGTQGVVNYNPTNGAFTYSPLADPQSLSGLNTLAEGEIGTDSFTYSIVADNGAVSTGIVTFNVQGQNDSPITQADDAGTVLSDSTLSINVADLLANDADAEDGQPTSLFTANNGDGLTTLGARIIDNGDGTLSYDPNGVFDGLAPGETVEDQFWYVAQDSDGAGSQQTWVTVTVEGPDGSGSGGSGSGSGGSGSGSGGSGSGTGAAAPEKLSFGDSSGGGSGGGSGGSGGGSGPSYSTLEEYMLANDGVGTNVTSVDIRGNVLSSVDLTSFSGVQFSGSTYESSNQVLSSFIGYTIENDQGQASTAEVEIELVKGSSPVLERSLFDLVIQDGESYTVNIAELVGAELAPLSVFAGASIDSQLAGANAEFSGRYFISPIDSQTIEIGIPPGNLNAGDNFVVTFDIDVGGQLVSFDVSGNANWADDVAYYGVPGGASNIFEAQGYVPGDFAVDDVVTVRESEVYSGGIISVLDNDLGTDLSIIGVSASASSFVPVQTQGNYLTTGSYYGGLVYDPLNNFGTDGFVYSGLGTFSAEQVAANNGYFNYDFNDGLVVDNLAAGEVFTQTQNYVVYDAATNEYDIATLTVEIIGENEDITGFGSKVEIFEDMAISFDEAFLLGDFYDSDNTVFSYYGAQALPYENTANFGVGLSISNIDASALAGTFVVNGDGTYSYDATNIYGGLADGESAVEYLYFDIVSQDGSVSRAEALEITIEGEGAIDGTVVANDDVFSVFSNTTFNADMLLNDVGLASGASITEIDITNSTVVNSFRLTDSGLRTEFNGASTSFDYTLSNGLNTDTGAVTLNNLEFSEALYPSSALPFFGVANDISVVGVELNPGDSYLFDPANLIAADSLWVFDRFEINNPSQGGLEIVENGDGTILVNSPASLPLGTSDNLDIVVVAVDPVTGVEFDYPIFVSVRGDGSELMTGTQIDIANDVTFDFVESDLFGTSQVLVTNDVPGTTIVSVEQKGAIGYNDVLVGLNQSNEVVAGAGFAQQFFTPGFLKPGEQLTETFEYTVVDENGNFDTATITVNVTGQDDPVTYAGATVEIDENQSFTFDESFFLPFAYDLDDLDQDIFVTGINGVTGSGWTFNGDISNGGSVTYDPTVEYGGTLNEGFSDTQIIQFDLQSADGSVGIAEVQFTINGVDETVV